MKVTISTVVMLLAMASLAAAEIPIGADLSSLPQVEATLSKPSVQFGQ